MKKIIAVILLLVMCLALCSCGYNKQVFDFNYSFKYAIIQRYDGEQLIALKAWNDYENSDMIQLVSTDGTVYLTHSANVILLSDLEK